MGERFAEYMNITADMLPTVRIHWITDTEVRRYIYKGQINSEGLVEFYEQWKEGSLQPVYKSEKIPEDNQKRLVKKVVGDNFDQLVRDKEKDVFLVITAPWCGDLCNKILQIFEQLASDNTLEDVIFAEMDTTLNEVEGLIIEQLPCIKFYPKDSKYQNIRYKGEYSVESFLKFLEQGNQEVSDPHEDL